ncbi:MAG: hypothetical protein ACKPA7_24945 [Sphaerospermopsis kisseleviana]
MSKCPQSPVTSPQRCTELVEVSPVPSHQSPVTSSQSPVPTQIFLKFLENWRLCLLFVEK